MHRDRWTRRTAVYRIGRLRICFGPNVSTGEKLLTSQAYEAFKKRFTSWCTRNCSSKTKMITFNVFAKILKVNTLCLSLEISEIRILAPTQKLFCLLFFTKMLKAKTLKNNCCCCLLFLVTTKIKNTLPYILFQFFRR